MHPQCCRGRAGAAGVETIDGPLIRRTILRMDGAAGPSGLDAAAWKRLCTSFKAASADLCEALASVARRICSSYLDPSGLTVFIACHLVALNKCPGVQPIGIGETPRRIIGKTIANALSDDIQSAPGPLQVGAGRIRLAVRQLCMRCANYSQFQRQKL